ncbi:MAG TPA: hypothetical protein VFC07_16665 [Verrucomicrobiae bacterium]|nr:hypothetical protein [Verrucomicrobiae bacterium]
MAKTELSAEIYRSYGLVTVRYSVLKVVAKVEVFENGCGFSSRVEKPRQKIDPT